jgi:hypothetical protein
MGDNEIHHCFLPVAAMISSDVQETTLQTFLEVIKTAVESQAAAIQGEI